MYEDVYVYGYRMARKGEDTHNVLIGDKKWCVFCVRNTEKITDRQRVDVEQLTAWLYILLLQILQ